MRRMQNINFINGLLKQNLNILSDMPKFTLSFEGFDHSELHEKCKTLTENFLMLAEMATSFPNLSRIPPEQYYLWLRVSTYFHSDKKALDALTKFNDGMTASHYKSGLQSANDGKEIVQKEVSCFEYHMNAVSCLCFSYEKIEKEFTFKISNTKDVEWLLGSMEFDECQYVSRAFKDRILKILHEEFAYNQPGLLKSSFDDLLTVFTPKMKALFCKIFLEQLPRLIKNRRDLEIVLENLNVPERTKIYKKMKSKLPQLISKASHFANVLKYLNPDQCKDICGDLHETLLKISRNGELFAQEFSKLSLPQFEVVCRSLKEWLPVDFKLSFSPLPWIAAVLKHLSVDKCELMCNTLPYFFEEETESLCYELKILSTCKSLAVYDFLKNNISNTIKNSLEFRLVLDFLPPGERTKVFEIMKDRLTDFIKKEEDLEHILKNLNQSQCRSLCELQSFQDKLPSIIRDANSFGLLLKKLEPAQGSGICEAFRDNITTIIESHWDFQKAISHINKYQLEMVFQALQNQIPKIISSSEKLSTILRNIDEDRRELIYRLMKGEISEFIKTPCDFLSVVEYLTHDQLAEVYIDIKENLPEIIQNGSYFFWIWNILNLDQRTEFYRSIKGRIPEIIKSGRDIVLILNHLSYQQPRRFLILLNLGW